MRIIAPALLLLLASCGRGDPGANQMRAPANASGGDARPAALPTITSAATGPGGCSANWDGQAVSPEQITQRSIALLEQAIRAAGGIQNIAETTLPTPNVEAPADLSFACADRILFALQRSGMANVRLKPTGGQAPVLADFPLDTGAPPPPIPTVLGIGAGGQVTWNNDPIDAAGLGRELERVGGSTGPVDPDEGAPPPGGLELRVTRDVTFGQLYDLLRTTSRYHLRPVVYLPSAKAAPAATSAPPPPGVPPPIVGSSGGLEEPPPAPPGR
jgi:hypothetical protein